MITGTANANNLTGTKAADVFFGGLGNDKIDGSGGIDTAIFTGRFQSYAIANTYNKNLTLSVSGPDGTDGLKSVELLKFDNATYDARTGVAQITTVSVTGSEVTEGDGHDLAFNFTRTGDLSRPLDVRYTFDTTGGVSSADLASGLGASTQTIHFDANQSTATLSLAVVDDGPGEAGETLGVSLIADTYYDFGASTSATGTINDHPVPARSPLLVTFDDIPSNEYGGRYVQDGYAGFNWDLAQSRLDPVETDSIGLAVSDINRDGTFEALNQSAQEFTFLSRADGSAFDFLSFKAMDWRSANPGADAENLIFTGYNKGDVVYTQEIQLTDAMTNYDLKFEDIDKLEIRTNAQDGWFDNNKGHFWMDDLSFMI